MDQGLSLVGDGPLRPPSEHAPSREPGEARAPLPTPSDAPFSAPSGATLSELFAASPRDGAATGFLLASLPRDRPLLWVQERMAILEGGRLYPPGLGLSDLIHVEARDARAALWAMEEGLRCAALGAVIGELWGDPRSLDFTATRRLAVAAERYGVAAYLIRLGGHANLSGARMRWRIGSSPSLPHPFDPRAPGEATWDAELFRARGAVPGRWITTRDRATDPVGVVALPADRTLAAAERSVA